LPTPKGQSRCGVHLHSLENILGLVVPHTVPKAGFIRFSVQMLPSILIWFAFKKPAASARCAQILLLRTSQLQCRCVREGENHLFAPSRNETLVRPFSFIVLAFSCTFVAPRLADPPACLLLVKRARLLPASVFAAEFRREEEEEVDEGLLPAAAARFTPTISSRRVQSSRHRGSGLDAFRPRAAAVAREVGTNGVGEQATKQGARSSRNAVTERGAVFSYENRPASPFQRTSQVAEVSCRSGQKWPRRSVNRLFHNCDFLCVTTVHRGPGVSNRVCRIFHVVQPFDSVHARLHCAEVAPLRPRGRQEPLLCPFGSLLEAYLQGILQCPASRPANATAVSPRGHRNRYLRVAMR
jgi:hypothetical protein